MSSINFNSNAQGKRHESLGSLDSDTLMNTGGEHPWRGTLQQPKRKPLTVEIPNQPYSWDSEDEVEIVYETDVIEDIDEAAAADELVPSLCEPPSVDSDNSGDSHIQYEADLTKEPAESQARKFIAQNEEWTDSQLPGASLSPLDMEKPGSLSSDDDGDVYVEIERHPVLKTKDAQREARNFAMEHRIFLKSLLALLAQRDLVAVDMDDPNTFKCGPLKKATQLVKGAWKIKYVEIRRGMFSYYDDALSKDAASEGDLVRKNVTLNANKCVCKAVKLNHKSLTHAPGNAIFELTVEGSPRRFWMTNSREERTAWIRAINDAMVGGAITRGSADQQIEHHMGRLGKISRKSPYRNDLAMYLKIQKEIKNASNKHAYVGAISCIVGKQLNIPVRFISDQHIGEETERAFREDAVMASVDQLWKDLARDSVLINGKLLKGGSGHAVERIIGTLTCDIIRMDRTSPLRPDDPTFKWKGVTELQAISFARDILLSGNRTRSGGDSYYCVDSLCQNPGMVVLVPSSLEAEPLKLTVEHDRQERTKNTSYSMHDRNGWLKIRTKFDRRWRNRFFVLSEGTLSFYKNSHPRPYGIEGQVKLSDSPVYAAPVELGSVISSKNMKDGEDPKKKCFLLTIKSKEGFTERQVLISDEDKFLVWAFAIEAALPRAAEDSLPKKNPMSPMFRMLALRDEGAEARANAHNGFLLAHGSLEANAEELGFDPATVVKRAKALALQYGGSKSPTVNVSVQASTIYKICTLDPQGNEEEDTWATVRATFKQSFSIVGGPNGLMNRSEEVVQINVLKCCRMEGRLPYLAEGSLITPRSLANSLTRKLKMHDGPLALITRAESS